jgi:predicted nuclease of restriction endonuclease-like (RecB) superfamily
MCHLYLAYKDEPILRQLVAEVPWKHNTMIMSLKDKEARAFYLLKVKELHWSREVLTFQIKNKAYQNLLTQSKTHNFGNTLPEELSKQLPSAKDIKKYLNSKKK